MDAKTHIQKEPFIARFTGPGLAKLLGVTHQAVYKWRHGVPPHHHNKLRKYAPDLMERGNECDQKR